MTLSYTLSQAVFWIAGVSGASYDLCLLSSSELFQPHVKDAGDTCWKRAEHA